MLQRNLLYTAVTRGKRLVVLVGTRKALALAVRNADVAARCSGLAPPAVAPIGLPRPRPPATKHIATDAQRMA